MLDRPPESTTHPLSPSCVERPADAYERRRREARSRALDGIEYRARRLRAALLKLDGADRALFDDLSHPETLDEIAETAAAQSADLIAGETE